MTRPANKNSAKGSDYFIGYGKPPVHSRFKPGQSGNPLGRPKGAKNKAVNHERLRRLTIEEAYRPIMVRDGHRELEMPTIQAVLRSVSLRAASGDPRSQKMLIELLGAIEHSEKADYDQNLQTLVEYKAYWEGELLRRQRTGETGEEPLPHPDDIHIDFTDGSIEIRGPITKEQKEFWKWVHAMDRQCCENIAELEMQVAKHPDDPGIQEDLARRHSFLARLRRIIGARSDWRPPKVE